LILKYDSGVRLERPANCPKNIYDLMKWCWDAQPENRPTFTAILASLKYMSKEGITIIVQVYDYLNLALKLQNPTANSESDDNEIKMEGEYAGETEPPVPAFYHSEIQ
jgi:hypothetical protein